MNLCLNPSVKSHPESMPLWSTGRQIDCGIRTTQLWTQWSSDGTLLVLCTLHTVQPSALVHGHLPPGQLPHTKFRIGIVRQGGECLVTFLATRNWSKSNHDGKIFEIQKNRCSIEKEFDTKTGWWVSALFVQNCNFYNFVSASVCPQNCIN